MASGHHVRRTLRCQFVSLSDPRDGLFDLAADYDGAVANAFRGTPTRFCVISFTSDWLFPTPESRAVVHALNAAGARVSFAEITTDKGHDAFLLDEPELFAIVRVFWKGRRARGVPTMRQPATQPSINASMTWSAPNATSS